MKKNTNNKTKINFNSEPKREYSKPELIPLGDIRDVTMGGSPGVGDSGAAGIEEPF